MDYFNKFKQITGQDARGFLTRYLEFIENDLNDLVSLFNGENTVFPEKAFKRLEALLSSLHDINDAVKDKSPQLTSYGFWELLEQITEAQGQLETILNLPRYLRSSRTLASFGANIALNYIQRQGESLEQIQRATVGSNNPDNDYYKTALSNRIEEEQYSPEGGLNLKIELDTPQTFDVQSVVDIMDSKIKLWGKDLDKVLTFKEGDLLVLEPSETLKQSSDILLGLRKGDSPEFPSAGLDRKLGVGSNLSSFAYPLITRQILDSFRTDDTFATISLKSIENNQDSISFLFQIEPKQGDVFDNRVLL